MCKFSKRKGKIDADSFFSMLLHCAHSGDPTSLTTMSTHLEVYHGIKVSRNAIQKRFNTSCELFVKSVLEEVLRERYSEYGSAYGQEVFASFNRIRIKDSTKFQIPSSMKEEFPGSGGCAGEAGVSIQFEYDIKNGQILYLKIDKGSANDHEEISEACCKIEPGDLIIRDLGYFSRYVFSELINNGAYFLSRLDSQSIVVVDKGRKRLSFKELYREMKDRGIEQKEITVLIGAGDQIKVRLLVSIVPEKVYEQRVRNAQKRNQYNPRTKHRKSGSKKPLKLKDETRARYRFTLLITNVKSDKLPLSKALPLYRIRWQIELVFKYWKGVYHIDKVQQMKKQRFICLLMAKLLLLTIQLQLIYRIQANFTHQAASRAKKKIEYLVLSPNKAVKTLHKLFVPFWRMIRGRMKITDYARMIQEVLSRNHTLERRKDKLSFLQILQLFVCKTR